MGQEMTIGSIYIRVTMYYRKKKLWGFWFSIIAALDRFFWKIYLRKLIRLEGEDIQSVYPPFCESQVLVYQKSYLTYHIHDKTMFAPLVLHTSQDIRKAINNDKARYTQLSFLYNCWSVRYTQLSFPYNCWGVNWQIRYRVNLLKLLQNQC